MYFQITESQRQKIKAWDDPKCGHKCICKEGEVSSFIGGRLSYIFTPTGLGEVIEVKCRCGATLDITESWD
jgi:hypothetical protein